MQGPSMEGSPHQKLLHFTSQEAEDIESMCEKTETCPRPDSSYKLKLWLQISIFTFLVLSGQIVVTLLGKVYYDYGGQSKWIATLVPFAGFPVLLPLLCFYSNTDINKNEPQQVHYIEQSSSSYNLVCALICAFLGLLLAANSLLYSVGLQYLPASTYSLISSTQLAFNAIFSFHFNGQKITPPILNSVVLLTLSSVLIIFQNESSTYDKEISLHGFLIGFLATIIGAAGFGLLGSLTELTFQKILKNGSFKVVMQMTIYQCFIATLVGLTGLFASGDWRNLEKEMEEFKLGKVSYILYLSLGTIYSQAQTLGSIGLIFKVSSLFSNVILILGAPLTQISAVVLLHDSVSGLKLVSLVLGLWGFTSYLYQQYLDSLLANAVEIRTSDHDVDEVESHL
ncbi:putative purine permease 10 isoform X1 [Nicotiana tabacum]|uniref:Probable purine permease n=1 Tax=Nicotiana tabacum TaxID=4097 RepID=A0A1S4DN40_TOBAC|nr:PREDICTED: probable purine permease 10 [Nicotiana tabacum]